MKHILFELITFDLILARIDTKVSYPSMSLNKCAIIYILFRFSAKI